MKTLLLTLLAVFSCSNQESKTDTLPTTNTKTNSEFLPAEVVEQLITLLQQTEDGSTVQLYNEADYASVEVKSVEGFPMGGSYFSKKIADNVTGDLDNDGKNDFLVKVESNSGGNSSYFDYFLFLNTNGTYKLAVPDGLNFENACTKEPYGMFLPTELKNGKIVGESLCMTEDDPRCCPSMIYNTSYNYQSGKVVLDTSVFKEKRGMDFYENQ